MSIPRLPSPSPKTIKLFGKLDFEVELQQTNDGLYRVRTRIFDEEYFSHRLQDLNTAKALFEFKLQEMEKRGGH